MQLHEDAAAQQLRSSLQIPAMYTISLLARICIRLFLELLSIIPLRLMISRPAPTQVAQIQVFWGHVVPQIDRLVASPEGRHQGQQCRSE
jgi:hypothetical protein